MVNANLKRATSAACITAVTFWILFQLSKTSAISEISPFAEDPYDAVASIAFQVALAVGLLSLARLVSVKNEQGLQQRVPFILRGILLVEASIVITLITDAIAIYNGLPLSFSTPLFFLLAGLTLLTLLGILTGILLVKSWRDFRAVPAEPASNALGQTIRDCWGLAAAVADWLVARIPPLKTPWRVVDSLARKVGKAWNHRLSFANPDRHPWQFVVVFSVLSGIFLAAGILISEAIWEGPPANPLIVPILIGIFFGIETVAILLSFLLFGGYLGLRPKIKL